VRTLTAFIILPAETTTPQRDGGGREGILRLGEWWRPVLGLVVWKGVGGLGG